MKKITVIAEIGINHGGDMGKASDMICQAKKAGADIAKFQIYRPEEILGVDSSYFPEAKRAELSLDQHAELKHLCDDVGIEWCASLFHPEHVEFTEKLGMKRYKIASRSNRDLELIQEVNRTGKDVLVSCRILDDARAIMRTMSSRVTPLYCIPVYPTKLNEIELENIEAFRSIDGRAGFSSHCPSPVPSLAAAVLGASVLESHVCFSREDAGCDIQSSITFEELKSLTEQVRVLEQMA